MRARKVRANISTARKVRAREGEIQGRVVSVKVRARVGESQESKSLEGESQKGYRKKERARKVTVGKGERQEGEITLPR